MELNFHTLDVFTETRFGGNPLAVVLGADALDGKKMQTIAREFNLSETVFVEMQRSTPANLTAKIRIFTPMHELPFAGHPTVGTACLLAQLEATDGKAMERRQVVLEEAVGDINCDVTMKGGKPAHAVFELVRLPEPHPHIPETAAIAEVLQIAPDDIGFENHQPSCFHAGLPYLMIPVRDLEVMARIAINTAAWPSVFATETTGDAYAYCRQCVNPGSAFHARMFAPGHGIPEDPATGSAVATFAGTIAKFDQPADGDHTYVIEQGFEMGRPSLIHLDLTMAGGQIESARIGGNAVRVMSGKLQI